MIGVIKNVTRKAIRAMGMYAKYLDNVGLSIKFAKNPVRLVKNCVGIA